MNRVKDRVKFSLGLLAVAALGMSLVSPAHAASTILFDADGTGPTAPISTIGFNWAAGDALAVGAITGVGIVPGSTFQLYYQTHLLSLNVPSGTMTPPGLGTTYQITEVASLTEVVSPLSTSSAAIFTLAPVQSPSSGLKIWYSPGTPANQSTGAGFITPGATPGDGLPGLIFSASFTSNQSNYTDTTKSLMLPTVPLDQSGSGNYPGITTDQGTGSTALNMSVLSANPTFFLTPGLFSSQFTSNLFNPFQSVATSLAFNDPSLAAGPTITPHVGANNGTSGPDFVLQVSGAAQTFSVPEPTSIVMALAALGIVPLATFQVRRRRARA